MELEQKGTLPFLDVLVKEMMDVTLGHTEYRKITHTHTHTHTHLYLHADSEYHPAQKRAVLSTLIHCA